MPRVTVLCYFHNEERFLRAMIESVLDQTHEDFELLLFDNGSTDGSREIAADFTDPRIRLVVSDVDVSGPDNDFAALNNHVFALARGDLIAVTGGDDLLLPDRLERQVRAFDADPELAVCHSAAHHIDEHSNLMPTYFAAAPYHAWNVFRMWFTYGQIAFPTVMFERASVERAGLFEGGYCPDFDFWMRTTPAGAGQLRYRYLDERLMYYRVHDRSASNSTVGLARCGPATVAIRAKIRAAHPIEDFFPEIQLCGDRDAARAAAHLELGNMMLAGGMADHELAFAEYQTADGYRPDHPAIVNNLGVVMSLDGQADEAIRALDLVGPAAIANKVIVKGLLRRPFELQTGREISPELYGASPPPGIWRSDGTVTTVTPAAAHV